MKDLGAWNPKPANTYLGGSFGHFGQRGLIVGVQVKCRVPGVQILPNGFRSWSFLPFSSADDLGDVFRALYKSPQLLAQIAKVNWEMFFCLIKDCKSDKKTSDKTILPSSDSCLPLPVFCLLSKVSQGFCAEGLETCILPACPLFLVPNHYSASRT